LKLIKIKYFKIEIEKKSKLSIPKFIDSIYIINTKTKLFLNKNGLSGATFKITN